MNWFLLWENSDLGRPLILTSLVTQAQPFCFETIFKLTKRVYHNCFYGPGGYLGKTQIVNSEQLLKNPTFQLKLTIIKCLKNIFNSCFVTKVTRKMLNACYFILHSTRDRTSRQTCKFETCERSKPSMCYYLSQNSWVSILY